MGTLKDVVDLTTQLANSVSDRKIAEELNKIQRLTLSLQSEQIDLHEKNIELREQNMELREELSLLKREKDTQESLIYEQEVYWREKNGKKEGPFCPRCQDAKKLMVRMEKDGAGWWCKECADHYGPSERNGYI